MRIGVSIDLSIAEFVFSGGGASTEAGDTSTGTGTIAPAGDNLKLWIAADLGVTQAGTITAWSDQSGQGNNPTVVSAPTYDASAQNGKPGASFAGGNKLTIAAAGLGIVGPHTIIGVWKTTASVADAVIFAQGATGLGVAGKLGLSIDSGSANYYYVLGTNKHITVTANVFHVVRAQWDGTTNANGQKQAVDGTETLETSVATGAIETTDAYIIGASAGGSSSNWTGELLELIVHNASMSAATVAAEEAYLKAKYATP